MKKKYSSFLIVFALISVNCSAQQTPSVRMTPVGDLALQSGRVVVPEKFKGKISDNLSLSVPPGFSAKIFYVGGL